MRHLIIEPEAKSDILRAAEYYESAREGLGREFLNELGLLIFRIIENPLQYPLYIRETRKTRLSRFPYLVLYRLNEPQIYLMAVMDGRRDPKSVVHRIR